MGAYAVGQRRRGVVHGQVHGAPRPSGKSRSNRALRQGSARGSDKGSCVAAKPRPACTVPARWSLESVLSEKPALRSEALEAKRRCVARMDLPKDCAFALVSSNFVVEVRQPTGEARCEERKDRDDEKNPETVRPAAPAQKDAGVDRTMR